MIPTCTLLWPPLLALLAGTQERPGAEEIHFQWKIAKDSVLVTALEIDSQRHSEIELSIEGNDSFPDHQSSHDFKSHYLVRHADRVLATSGGRPCNVERTFVELESTSEVGEEQRELESPLAGQRVGIDSRGEETEIELPEDLELDERQERALRIAADLGAFLPEEAVQVGASWDFDAKLYARLNSYGRGLFTYPESELPEGTPEGAVVVRMGAGRQEGARASKPDPWEGTCKLVAVEEQEGHRIAQVAIKARLSVAAEDTAEPEEGSEGDEGNNVRISFSSPGDREASLAGTLLFDLDAGRIRSLKLESTMETENEQEKETQMGTLIFSSISSATKTISLAFEEGKGENK